MRTTTKDLATYLKPPDKHPDSFTSNSRFQPAGYGTLRQGKTRVMLQEIPEKNTMKQFRRKPGTKSAVHHLKTPFTDIMAFNTVVQSLIMKNPLGCTSWWTVKKHHPPLVKVREIYTAKFVYEDGKGKRIGSGSELYDTVEGYQYGIAAVISNMANIAAHRGKVRHIPASDRFSALLKCHNPNGEQFFLSIARNRVTLSSYSDDQIRKKVEQWADDVLTMV